MQWKLTALKRFFYLRRRPILGAVRAEKLGRTSGAAPQGGQPCCSQAVTSRAGTVPRPEAGKAPSGAHEHWKGGEPAMSKIGAGNQSAQGQRERQAALRHRCGSEGGRPRLGWNGVLGLRGMEQALREAGLCQKGPLLHWGPRGRK